jgi:hypothetical protein
LKVRVSDVYEGVLADINISASGQITTKQFNIWLKRAEIFLIHFLTGNITNANDFPMPYEKQKCKDYLKNFIARKKFSGEFVLPDDYYQWDNLFKLGSYNGVENCDGNEVVRVEGCDIQVPILDGQQFNARCNSEIEGLRPTEKNPIAKIVNNKVELKPTDAGSVSLEYIRYPKFGKLVMKRDSTYNTEVVDDEASGELEWDVWALEFLIWIVIDFYSKRVRNKSLKEFNLTNKPQ